LPLFFIFAILLLKYESLFLNLIEYFNEKEEWEASKEILFNKEMMDDDPGSGRSL